MTGYFQATFGINRPFLKYDRSSWVFESTPYRIKGKKNVSVCNITLYDNSLQLQNNQSKILGIFNASVERYPDVS